MHVARVTALLLAVAAAFAPAARAEGDAVPPEIKERFLRAIELFNRGDLRGAVVEFEKVRAVHPRPVISYNLGLVYAALGDPARAVVLLDEVLANPGTLPAARVDRAKAVRAEQLAQLGELAILIPLEGAEVQVDGAPVGRSPMPAPVRVKAGEVLVRAAAPKHKPAEDAVRVQPGGRAEVKLELLPLERQLAQLTVKTATPAAELFVDGKRVAREPFHASVPLEPGSHRLELRRAGFKTLAETLELGDGADAQWGRDLEEDPDALAHDGAKLTIAAGPGAVELTVDGRRRGLLTGPVALVPGPHVLTLARGGFYPETREVQVSALQELRLDVAFEPTPELRRELETTRDRNRVLGIGGLALGGAALGAGIVYLAYNYTASATLQRKIDDLTMKLNSSTVNECTPVAAGCGVQRDQAQAQLRDAETLRVLGFLSGGLGVALVTAGVYLLATAPDPTRYDRPRDDRLIFDMLAFDPRPGGGQVTLSGRF